MPVDALRTGAANQQKASASHSAIGQLAQPVFYRIAGCKTSDSKPAALFLAFGHLGL
jgi:hypothetical protein